jgi:hypothetical protein
MNRRFAQITEEMPYQTNSPENGKGEPVKRNADGGRGKLQSPMLVIRGQTVSLRCLFGFSGYAPLFRLPRMPTI